MVGSMAIFKPSILKICLSGISTGYTYLGIDPMHLEWEKGTEGHWKVHITIPISHTMFSRHGENKFPLQAAMRVMDVGPGFFLIPIVLVSFHSQFSNDISLCDDNSMLKQS